MSISPIKRESLEKYFSNLYTAKVKVNDIKELGKAEKTKELKGFGYGIPYLFELLVNGETKRVVIGTMRPGDFGHEHFSDRAQILLWQHSAFDNIPRHVRSLDVGAFTVDASLKSLGDCKEFFLITEFVEGEPYHLDIERVGARKSLTKLDRQRCRALSDYLVDVHSVKAKDPASLYVRRIRDLIGHGECIMGLTDSYPSGLEYVDEEFLVKIEKKCMDWRWKIKKKTHRCARVHGDFHPWNVLFREAADFTVLDRSRGEWGEPADDVTSMSINYLFYSLQIYGRLDGPFRELFETFLTNYLNKTGDEEMLTVVQPFYAWRGLVVASPLWYPNLQLDVRKKIFTFITNVLETDRFDLKQVNSYLSC